MGPYKTQSLYSWPIASTDIPLTENILVCLVVFCCNLLKVFVLEGREKTMCDLRFWLLRGLGVEAPATARAVHFCGALLVGIIGLNDGFFCHMSVSVVYCVADCCAGG